MSGPPLRADAEDDKSSLFSAEAEIQSDVNDPNGQDKDRVKRWQDGELLHVPRTGSIRPVSPDTLSTFSIDDIDGRGGGRPIPLVGSIDRHASRSPAPPKTWRARWQQFWQRNKGIVLMLFAQVFGVLMNVTTRLLEIEGNQGNGMHPFQVSFVSPVPDRLPYG
jgi:hypothetical protein